MSIFMVGVPSGKRVWNRRGSETKETSAVPTTHGKNHSFTPNVDGRGEKTPVTLPPCHEWGLSIPVFFLTFSIYGYIWKLKMMNTQWKVGILFSFFPHLLLYHKHILLYCFPSFVWSINLSQKQELVHLMLIHKRAICYYSSCKISVQYFRRTRRQVVPGLV